MSRRAYTRRNRRAPDGTPEGTPAATPAGLARERPGSLGRCRCWRHAGVGGWRRSVNGPSSCSRLHRQPIGVVHTCMCEYVHHHVRACEHLRVCACVRTNVCVCVCVCVRARARVRARVRECSSLIPIAPNRIPLSQNPSRNPSTEKPDSLCHRGSPSRTRAWHRQT